MKAYPRGRGIRWGACYNATLCVLIDCDAANSVAGRVLRFATFATRSRLSVSIAQPEGEPLMQSKNDHSRSASARAKASDIEAKWRRFRPCSVVEHWYPPFACPSTRNAAVRDRPSNVPLSESRASKAPSPSFGTPRNDQFWRSQAIRSVIAQYLR